METLPLAVSASPLPQAVKSEVSDSFDLTLTHVCYQCHHTMEFVMRSSFYYPANLGNHHAKLTSKH